MSVQSPTVHYDTHLPHVLGLVMHPFLNVIQKHFVRLQRDSCHTSLRYKKIWTQVVNVCVAIFTPKMEWHKLCIGPFLFCYFKKGNHNCKVQKDVRCVRRCRCDWHNTSKGGRRGITPEISGVHLSYGCGRAVAGDSHPGQTFSEGRPCYGTRETGHIVKAP